MKTIALVGPTASGKSDLAIRCAHEAGARILSLDSLSIYRSIDIASAKPTPEERGNIVHYGIDVLAPDDPFSVTTFLQLYRQAHAECMAAEVPLIIVGGTSFYLKILLEGISDTPEPDVSTRVQVDQLLRSQESAYALLAKVDPQTAARIDPKDRYRLEKMLTLYLQTGQSPSHWFEQHPPQALLPECPLFEIDVERAKLRERITLRTRKMLASGLIDEIAGLERSYGRSPHPMKAIGIIEVLDFFDGIYTFQQLEDAIATHTAQLAKRQQTFNRTQFNAKTLLPYDDLFDAIRQILH